MKAILLPLTLIEAKPASGKPRIIGKGVTVQFLAGLLDNPEWPMVRICEEFDLTPAEVYAAWAFYYEHQAEIDGHIAADRKASQALQATPRYKETVAALKDRH